MKNYIYILIFVSSLLKVNGQQTAQFDQAAEEFGLVNAAGLTFEEMRLKGIVVNLNIRNQWWNTQVDGKPTTQVLSCLYNKNDHNHFGATFISDQIGVTRDLGLSLRYAHSLAPGLKIGLGMGSISHRISVNELDQFDDNDPIAAIAGETRWKLNANAGIFYHFFDHDRAWNWFAGAAMQRFFYTKDLPGEGKTQSETHILGHGGIGWNKSWWLGGRMRISVNMPDALDLYLRKYFADQTFFLGVIATSDKIHQTIGGQLGYEWLLNSSKFDKEHHIIASIGFSKPVSSYIEGSNLIFDARLTWALDNQNSF